MQPRYASHAAKPISTLLLRATGGVPPLKCGTAVCLFFLGTKSNLVVFLCVLGMVTLLYMTCKVVPKALLNIDRSQGSTQLQQEYIRGSSNKPDESKGERFEGLQQKTGLFISRPELHCAAMHGTELHISHKAHVGFPCCKLAHENKLFTIRMHLQETIDLIS